MSLVRFKGRTAAGFNEKHSAGLRLTGSLVAGMQRAPLASQELQDDGTMGGGFGLRGIGVTGSQGLSGPGR